VAYSEDAMPAVLAVIFLATLIRSASGFGEALIAVPLSSQSPWPPLSLSRFPRTALSGGRRSR
jgi:hypothetical protein